MVRKPSILLLAALLLTGVLAFAQDSAQIPSTVKKPRKLKAAPGEKGSLTVENESVKVIIGENGIIIQKPSGETKTIPLPPEEMAQTARIKSKQAQRKYEKSGFVLGDSVYLEEPPETEKTYRSHNLSGDRVAFGRTIRVEENEELGGDAVAIFGRVEVEGKVNGDVVAPFGSVYLGPRAEVGGDVVSGHLEKEEGAIVRGSEVTVGVSSRGAGVFKHPRTIYGGEEDVSPALFIVFFAIFGFAALLSILTWALVPHRVENAKALISENFFKTFFIGFLGEILFFPAFILLCVTIIGIPVALVLLLVALPLAFILGYAAFDLSLGERLKKAFNFTSQSQLLLILLGKLFSFMPILAGSFIMVLRGPLFPLGIVLFVIGLVVRWVAGTAGLGAVVKTRYGGRAKTAAAPPTGPGPAPVISPQPSTPPVGA